MMLNASQREFEELVSPHLTAIQLYCYRMLGTLQDAEDALQETLLRAWKHLGSLQDEGSLRSWLYKIATNVCFDALKHKSRREIPLPPIPEGGDLQSEPALLPEKAALEPIPEAWLGALAPEVEAAYAARESVRLAFMAALQVLPPRQRAVVILRDVLEMSALESAEALGISIPSVNSALLRARSSLEKSSQLGSGSGVTAQVQDEDVSVLLDQYVRAWEAADVPRLIELFSQDIAFTMPPATVWFKGMQKIRTLLTDVLFGGGARDLWRLLPTRANGQPAFGLYVLNPEDGSYHPYAIQVLTVRAGRIAEATNFLYPSYFSRFGLPEKIKK